MSFQKRVRPEDFKDVRIARVSYREDGSAACSCSWVTPPARDKVQEDRIDRHLNKRHGGRGFRL